MSLVPPIQITAPKVHLTLTVNIGKFSEMTGLQYMLMRMIDFVHESGRDMALRNVLDEFGIPRELAGLLENVLIDLRTRSMIVMTQSISEYSSLMDINFTEQGKILFREGYIMTEGRSVDESITVYPATNAKYTTPKNLKLVKCEKQYQYDLPNENSLSEALRNKWKKNKDLSKKIFKGMVVTESEIEHYSVNLYPKFISDGVLEVMDGATVSEEFILKNYTGDELFEAMHSYWELGQLPLTYSGEYGSGPKGEFSIALPCTLEYRDNQLILYNENRLTQTLEKTNVRSGDLPFDADMIVIIRKDLAFAYWFVKKQLFIKGYPESRDVTVLAFSKLNDDLIPVLTTPLEYSHLVDGFTSLSMDQVTVDEERVDTVPMVEIPSDLFETKNSADRGNEEDQFRMGKYLVSIDREQERYLGFYYLVWSAFRKQDLFDYFIQLIDENTYPLIARASDELADKGYIIKTDIKSE